MFIVISSITFIQSGCNYSDATVSLAMNPSLNYRHFQPCVLKSQEVWNFWPQNLVSKSEGNYSTIIKTLLPFREICGTITLTETHSNILVFWCSQKFLKWYSFWFLCWLRVNESRNKRYVLIKKLQLGDIVRLPPLNTPPSSSSDFWLLFVLLTMPN